MRITGTNLLNGGNVAVKVTLAGVSSTILSSTDTEVVVIAGAGPVKGSVGRVIIEGDILFVSGIGADVWRYLPQITAGDVSPQTGQSGTRVSIDLKGILLTISGVYLAEVQANGPVSVSGTRVVVEASPSSSTAVSGIRVEFVGGGVLTIPEAWSYLEPVEVTRITPNRGYFNTSISIVGINFKAGGRVVDYVEVAGIICTEVISQTDTLITSRVVDFLDSSSDDIVGPVRIVSEDGAGYTSENVTFTYVKLKVTAVSPSVGQRGTVVSITGVGLLAGASSSQPLQSAQLNGVNVEDEVTLTDTHIVFTASSSLGSGDISYTVADGGCVTITNAWSYIQPGIVTDVMPLQDVHGSYVTIRGEGLLQGGSTVIEVTVAGVSVMEIIVGKDDFIQVRLGRSAETVAGFISIKSDSGALLESTPFQFQYLPSGSISSVEPSSGQNGTRVAITGSHFLSFGQVSSVRLAGVEATIKDSEVSDTYITVEAGRACVFDELRGEVVIESVSGEIISGEISTSEFTYHQEGVIDTVIDTVIPSQGLVGTRVTINGRSMFGGGTNLANVYLAGVEAVIDENNSNESVVIVTVSSASSAPGVVGDIILVSNAGAYVRKTGAWSHTLPGDVTDIDPCDGQFGTEITITGTGLLAGGDYVAEIRIGSAVTTNISLCTDTEIKARIGKPPSTEGFTDTVTLITNFGGQLPSTYDWTYLNSSTVFTVEPKKGAGGQSVSIQGQNLFGGGTSIRSIKTVGIEATILNKTSDVYALFRVNFHPAGHEVQGDIVIESDTGALTILDNEWSYERSCPAGQFGTVENCALCHEQCTKKGCMGPSDEDCLECKNFVIPLSGHGDKSIHCVSKCPRVSTISKVCVDKCNFNQYIDTDPANGAQFCNDLCDSLLGCSGPDPTDCDECEVARDRDSWACVSSCGEGTWLNPESRECVPCHTQCETTAGCYGETDAHCNACQNVGISSFSLPMTNDGPIVTDNQSTDTTVCLESCPNGYYESPQRVCSPCHKKCHGECTGPEKNDCIGAGTIDKTIIITLICVVLLLFFIFIMLIRWFTARRHVDNIVQDVEAVEMNDNVIEEPGQPANIGAAAFGARGTQVLRQRFVHHPPPGDAPENIFRPRPPAEQNAEDEIAADDENEEDAFFIQPPNDPRLSHSGKPPKG